VVEDQPGLTTSLRANLEARGYVVLLAGDAPGALELLASHDPDIILLDSRVLGLEGTLEQRELLGRAILRQMRQASLAPVILLAAPMGVTDTVMGLKMGADDYVVQPVAIRELVARMQAILRRAGPGQGAPVIARP
jgi:two-component system phosphate regulon response regulator PhoB